MANKKSGSLVDKNANAPVIDFLSSFGEMENIKDEADTSRIIENIKTIKIIVAAIVKSKEGQRESKIEIARLYTYSLLLQNDLDDLIQSINDPANDPARALNKAVAAIAAAFGLGIAFEMSDAEMSASFKRATAKTRRVQTDKARKVQEAKFQIVGELINQTIEDILKQKAENRGRLNSKSDIARAVLKILLPKLAQIPNRPKVWQDISETESNIKSMTMRIMDHIRRKYNQKLLNDAIKV